MKYNLIVMFLFLQSCSRTVKVEIEYKEDFVEYEMFSSNKINPIILENLSAYRAIPLDCNINFLYERKVLVDNFIHFKEKSNNIFHIYGVKKIFSNQLILYSDFKKNEIDVHEAFFLIWNKNNTYKIKAFENFLLSNHFLKSYVFDNYIILMLIIDDGYDLVTDDNVEETKVKIQIIEVLREGGIRNLSEEKSKNIYEKFLKDQK
ncbi:MAG: hypothetical protein V3U92_12830 [Cellulophaga sp.]